MFTLILIVLIVCLLVGAFGHPHVGYWGWSPLGLVLVVLLILFLIGAIRV